MNRREKALLSSVLVLFALSVFSLNFNVTLINKDPRDFKGEFHYYVTAILYHHVQFVKPNGEIVSKVVSITLLLNQPNTVTTIGLNWTRDQLGDSTKASSTVAKYISLSQASSTPLSSWTQLDTEITASDLIRATGTYTASAGNGVWTITHTFTASNSYTVTTTGLQWSVTSNSNNNLLAAVKFGTSATMVSGDTLAVTWSNSVTG
jgi:hypothetical protein